MLDSVWMMMMSAFQTWIRERCLFVFGLICELGMNLWRFEVVMVVLEVEGGYGGDVVVMEVVEAFGYGGN
jgi:hypothetical protein